MMAERYDHGDDGDSFMIKKRCASNSMGNTYMKTQMKCKWGKIITKYQKTLLNLESGNQRTFTVN